MAAPDARYERLREFATDLAVGYDEGAWGVKLWLEPLDDRSLRWQILDAEEDQLLDLPMEKWRAPPPDITGLRSVGYVEAVDKERKDPFFGAFLLTEKCLALARRNAGNAMRVFISYRRDESSALALLLHDRIGQFANARPYLDKELEPGEEWHGALEEKVRGAGAFICLLGEKTLSSRSVRREMEWALDSQENKMIIPVWQPRFAGGQGEAPALLKAIQQFQAVVIQNEGALELEAGLNQILNRLGYSSAIDAIAGE